MNGPTAAVVIFFLLMCVKRLLLSLTPLLRYDTHTHIKREKRRRDWLKRGRRHANKRSMNVSWKRSGRCVEIGACER